MAALILLVVVVFFFALYLGSIKEQKLRLRSEFIRDYTFHPAIEIKLKRKHPQLTDAQIDFVIEALRDYFYICNQAKGYMVSMPSQAVDDLWHEFILFSHDYETFCHKAFNRFLYHTPAEAMKTPTTAQVGIKRAWRLACQKESIDAQKPSRLPRLFAVDSQLAIAGGFIYSLDCRALTSDINEFCASNIGCGGGCGGSSGCGGGDGGGCGGSGGCGGGGCGGGGCGS